MQEEEWGRVHNNGNIRLAAEQLADDHHTVKVADTSTVLGNIGILTMLCMMTKAQ